MEQTNEGDTMKRTLAVALVLFASAAFAQDKNPVTSAVKEILPRQQKNLVAAAEAMPADKYSYKPSEGQMTYGHLMLHIIESNNLFCSKVSDMPAPKPPVELKETDGKDKLVTAMKASFDFCTTALAKTDDSKLSDEIELFGGRKGTRAFGLIVLTSSWADHYGAASQYLRLNGILPPTAQPKK